MSKAKEIINRYGIIIFIIFWFVINLVSAATTELYFDEAYYWMYSQYPAFGYFDHPPMIALWIYLGNLFSANEIGVRIFSIIFTTLAIYIIYRLSDFKNWLVFSLLILSIASINFFGFLSLPDNCLLFFAALFFLTYKNFLKDDSFLNSIFLALTMSGLMYSKYHGILIIGFTILSNLNILKNKYFILSVLLSVLLYVPHIYWQIVNHFPPFQYHLIDRVAKSYSFGNTLEYLYGQLFYFGPFTGFFLIPIAFNIKTNNLFERALKFNVVGTFLFFLVFTFRQRIEVNWTIALCIPMVLLTLKYVYNKPKVKKWIIIVCIPGVALLFFARVQISHKIIDIKINRVSDLQGHKAFAKKVLKFTGDAPIAANRYQTASLLSFYTGRKIPVLNFDSRRSQFDIWKMDTLLINKDIWFIDSHFNDGIPLIDEESRNVKLSFIKQVSNYRDIMILTNSEFINAKANDFVTVAINLKSQLNAGFYRKNKDSITFVSYFIVDDKNNHFEFQNMRKLNILDINSLTEKFNIKTPSKKGNYNLHFTLYTNGLGIWTESKTIELIVE